VQIAPGYKRCVADETFRVIASSLILRAIFVVGTPFAAIFLLAFIAVTLEWVRDGYRNSN
jgi:hypothetical protein